MENMSNECSKDSDSPLLKLISSHTSKLCVLSYILGVAGFLALPYRDISEYHYHSENALLTGMQTPNYGSKEQRIANLINQDFIRIRENGMQNLRNDLVNLMRDYGIVAYLQDFSFYHPFPVMEDQVLKHQIRNGSNVYGFIRAGRAASTESIVLNIPVYEDHHNYAMGFALSIGRQIRNQPFWAKDIVLLFSDMGYIGSQAWLQSYYDTNSDFIKGNPLQERAGAILGALNLEFSDSPSFINVEVVGNKGQLPNLDLVNVVRKLKERYDVKMAVGGFLHKNSHIPYKNYIDSLTTCLKMFSKQAKGFSDYNHATFLQHNIQSLTIQALESTKFARTEVYQIGRIVEGAMRSLNNLLEKLHHSYFFYLISAPNRFISIVLYMPPLGLILLAPTLKALSLWINRKKRPRSRDSKILSDEELEGQQSQHDSPWIGVFYRIALAELVGVILYFSPTFATSWSAMYGISSSGSISAIFLSTYFAALVIPFNPLVRSLGGMNTSENQYVILRIVSLLLFSVIIGCAAVMNFSLAMLVAVVAVPFLAPIASVRGKWKAFYIVITLLSSPIVVAVIANYAEMLIMNGRADGLWDLTTVTLKSFYEQSLLGNNWNYEFICLLLYPSWMLFWFLAVSTPSGSV